MLLNNYLSWLISSTVDYQSNIQNNLNAIQGMQASLENEFADRSVTPPSTLDANVTVDRTTPTTEMNALKLIDDTPSQNLPMTPPPSQPVIQSTPPSGTGFGFQLDISTLTKNS